MGAVRHQECQRALTQKQTLGAGGALELGDLGLLEDGRELGDALVSDAVAVETVRKGRGGDDENASVSAGADMKANAFGAAAHSSEVTELPLSPSHSFVMPSAV